MEIADLIQRVTDELNELAARRAALHEELARVEFGVNRASTRLAVLQDLAKTLGLEPPPPAEPTPTGWSGLNRQEASLRALEEAGRPLHLREIVDYLREQGRMTDTVGLISAALAALKRKGFVRPGERRGVWQIVPGAVLTPLLPDTLLAPQPKEDTG